MSYLGRDHGSRWEPDHSVVSRHAFYGALLVLTGGFAVANSQAKEWPLKYELGTEFVRRGDTVTMSVGSNLITVRNSRGLVLFTFSAAAVGELDRDTDGSDLYVYVSWQDNIDKRRVMLKGGNKESVGLVHELEMAAGRQCQNRLMAEERRAERADVYSGARLVTYEPAQPAGQQGGGAQEEAFHFPVGMARGLFGTCNGFLRVTRGRIAFNPAFSPECSGYGFDLLLGDMRLVESVNYVARELKISGKSYRFCSLFFKPLGEAWEEKEDNFWSLFRRVTDRFDYMADRYRVMQPQPRFRQPPSGKVWYAQSRPEGELRITASEDQLWLEGEPGAALSIPYPSITDVVYETYRLAKERSDASLALLMGWGGLVIFGAITILDELIPPGRQRYVHIFWNQADGGEGITSLQIKPRQGEALLKELAGRITIPTVVPDLQLERFRPRIENEKDNSRHLILDENAVLSEAPRRPLRDIYWFQRYPVHSGRNYQILLLREGNQQGMVVLFEGDKVRSERAVAFAPVTISPLSEVEVAAAEAPTRVQLQTSGCRITEIRTEREILRLPPAPSLRRAMP